MTKIRLEENTLIENDPLSDWRTVADTPEWKFLLLSISVGSSSCHKRNRIQSLCKILGGKHDVLLDLRK